MKFTATKKTIVILILSFLVLVLGIISFIYRDFISNGIRYGKWFSVDENKDLLEFCNSSYEGGKINIECKALLEEMYVSDSQENNICYKVKIVSSKDSLLHDYEICNNPKNIFFENPYKELSYNTVLPIHLALIYHQRDADRKYSLEKIQMGVLSDEESYKKLYGDEILMKQVFSLRKVLMTDLVYNASVVGCNNMFPNTAICEIYLYGAKLEAIVDAGESTILTFSWLTRNSTNKHILNLQTDGFAYTDIKLNENDERYISGSKIQEILVQDNEYDIALSFISNYEKNDKKELASICTIKDDHTLRRKSFCNRITKNSDLQHYDIQNSNNFVEQLENNNGTWLYGMTISHIISLGRE